MTFFLLKGRNKSGQCGYLPEAYIEVLKSDSKNRSAASSNSGSSCSGKKPVVAPKPVISIEPEGCECRSFLSLLFQSVFYCRNFVIGSFCMFFRFLSLFLSQTLISHIHEEFV